MTKKEQLAAIKDCKRKTKAIFITLEDALGVNRTHGAADLAMRLLGRLEEIEKGID